MSVVECWKKYRVRDVCDLGRGRVISGQEIEHNPGIFPVYSSQSSNNGKMGSIDTFDFDGEYVTWTTDGAYAGTVFYRSGQFNCTNVCGTLHAKDSRISMPFIAYKLSTLAKEHVSYVGNPKLMNGVMANIELSIPTSKPEQAQIAEILSTVDRAIEQAVALIDKQQRIKIGLMQDILTRGIDEHGNRRTEQTHKFKDSPLGRIPLEWANPQIGNIAVHVGSGVTPRGGEAVYTKEGILFIRSQNVHFGGLHLSDVSYISQRIHDTMRRSEVFENDVLLNITGASIGRCCAMPKINCPANVNQHVCAIRLDQAAQSDAGFLVAVIESSIGQNQILKFNAGGNREGLNYEQVKSFVIPWPEVEERQRSHALIKEAEETLEVSRLNLEKFRSIKTGLMQDLLTGKKRVTSLLFSESKNRKNQEGH
jgi:type I restriction enzyme S subunit